MSTALPAEHDFDALLALADNLENALAAPQQPTTTKKRPAVAAPPAAPPARRDKPLAASGSSHVRDLLGPARAPSFSSAQPPPQAQHYVATATGIKIRNPLYGGTDLKHMWARLPGGLVALADADAAAASSASAGRGPPCFVTVGVLVRKEARRARGGAGGAYSAWRLADLRGAEATLLLFGDAHERHAGTTCEGSVVAATVGEAGFGGGGASGGMERAWRAPGADVVVFEEAEAAARGGGDGDGGWLDGPRAPPFVPELAPRGGGRDGGGGGGGSRSSGGPMSVRTGAQLLVLGTSAGFAFCRGVVRGTGERCRRAVDGAEGGSGLCSLHAVGQRSSLRADLRRISGPGGGAAAGAAAAAGQAGGMARGAMAGGGGTLAAATAAPALTPTQGAAMGMGGLLIHASAPWGSGGGTGGARLLSPASGGGGGGAGAGGGVMADAARRRAELSAALRQNGGLAAPRDPNDVSAAAMAARERERAGGQGDWQRQGQRQQQQSLQLQQGLLAARAAAAAAPKRKGSTAAAAAASLLEGRCPDKPAFRQQQQRGQQQKLSQADATAATRAAIPNPHAAAGKPKPQQHSQQQQRQQQQRQQRAPAIPSGPGALAFAAAFGAAATAPPAAPADAAVARDRELAALADAHAAAATGRLLAQYEQKDELAAQLEGTTATRVEAWRCDTCRGGGGGGAGARGGGAPPPPLATRRSALRACLAAGHRVSRTTAVMRWWSCGACGWRLTTLGVLLPTGRCAKCRDPAGRYLAQNALGGAGEAAARAMGYDGETTAVSAGREAMMPRGVEHAFSLNSLR